MIPDTSLCRFVAVRPSVGAPGVRLGYIQGGQLYDLTATGRAAFATFEAWLQAAAGRVPEALAELNTLSKFDRPLGAAKALFAPQGPFKLLAPLDTQEVWACGVTYEMSMDARKRESTQPTIYGKVYEAPRPEVFFKAPAHRVVGPGEAVGVREDSTWDVPEPELTLVVTPQNEIIGFTVGNDMSSRDIEGQNPLYLPQAKVYNRCCALGPFVRLATADFNPLTLGVKLVIYRGGKPGFSGESSTSKIHRRLEELVSWLGRCNSFPTGLFVVTGTGIVPPDTFTLKDGDVVEITIQGLGTLTNPVTLLKVS